MSYRFPSEDAVAPAIENALVRTPHRGSQRELCDAVSKGALRGARGNSGVILSQLFRGICSELKKADTVTIKSFAKAMESGTKVAYSAVSKPKEGTMRTVARLMSEFARQSAPRYRDFSDFLADVIKKG